MTGFQWESPLLWWSVSMSYQIWVAKNTMIQICHWISKFTCKSDNYTHSDTSILFHCQCPQLRSVYLKGRSLRRQNWLNWMECFSGLPNLPHSQVLLFEIKILIQEAGLPPDWPNSGLTEWQAIPTSEWKRGNRKHQHRKHICTPNGSHHGPWRKCTRSVN